MNRTAILTEVVFCTLYEPPFYGCFATDIMGAAICMEVLLRTLWEPLFVWKFYYGCRKIIRQLKQMETWY